MHQTDSIIEQVAQILHDSHGLIVSDERMVTDRHPGTFRSPVDLPLAAPVQDYVQKAFPAGLYEHQHAALAHVLRGEHTVVATRTSSGKSLIYALPVLDSLCRDKDATALFLYPQKALAGDQSLKLNESIVAIPGLATHLRDRPLFASRYDGSTDTGLRPQIRQQAQIILTNPEMLHLALLQYHGQNWSRFFRNLKYVVIDECHAYRGLFGTGVACLLRRLRAVCGQHGSSPIFVATSATVHRPQQHLEKLTGCPFQLVGPERDGSRQGAKKFWIVRGEDHFYDLGRKLALELTRQGLTVLAFCESRKAAERLTFRAKSDSDTPDEVEVYRSGLQEDERARIEQGLRDGSIRLVFTTTALELGIDIGAVDVVVGIGLPASTMSLWQRAGRAGRGGKDGAVILVPANTPADTYYADHPDEFYSRDHEPLVLSLNNTRVVQQHFTCATAEAGGDEDRLNLEVLGEAFREIDVLRRNGSLPPIAAAQPHQDVNFRSVGGGMLKLVQYGMGTEAPIGEIDLYHLLSEAPTHAVYWHGGKPYRVHSVDQRRQKVKLVRELGPLETVSISQKRVRLLHADEAREYSAVTIAKAAIEVQEFLVNVVEKDRYTGKVVKDFPGDNGVRIYPLPTEGTLLRIKGNHWAEFAYAFEASIARSALGSLERMLASLFPTVAAVCDPQDFSVLSHITPQGDAEIYLYDLAYEGVGLTTAAYEKLDDLIARALKRVHECSCDQERGCLRCVGNPHIDEETHKEATLALLQLIHKTLQSEQPKIRQLNAAIPAVPELKECPVCSATVPGGNARFCSMCGEPLS